VNVYRPFYYEKTALAMAKPRFTLRNGVRELLPNPIATEQELERLLDPDFVRTLGKYDHWYNRDDYPELTFPYVRILLNKRLWLEAFYGRAEDQINDMDPRPWENLWEVAEARNLLFSILDGFVKDVRRLGATPVIVLFPRKKQVFRRFNGIATENALRLTNYCEAKSYHCFDGIAAFSKRVNSEREIRALYSGHFSPKGHRVFARQLYRYLVAEKLVRGYPVTPKDARRANAG